MSPASAPAAAGGMGGSAACAALQLDGSGKGERSRKAGPSWAHVGIGRPSGLWALPSRDGPFCKERRVIRPPAGLRRAPAKCWSWAIGVG